MRNLSNYKKKIKPSVLNDMSRFHADLVFTTLGTFYLLPSPWFRVSNDYASHTFLNEYCASRALALARLRAESYKKRDFVSVN